MIYIISILNPHSTLSRYPQYCPLSTSYLFIMIMIIRAINNWVTVRVSCSEYSGLEREVNAQHIPSSAYIYPVFPPLNFKSRVMDCPAYHAERCRLGEV